MMTTDDLDENGSDICRVCRTEATSDKPLYHPCLCTGSIKFVHQDCLTQWLKYSRKEFCELCNHKYTFMPIYHPDMPKRLPVREFLWGLVSNLARAVRFWFHYTLVAVAWLGVVPLTACRIYRCLFRGSVNSLLTLPLDMLSTDNLVGDCLQGAFIIILTLCAFVSLVWLREQIIHGGPPQWLNLDINMNGNNNNRQQQQQPPVAQAEAVDHNAAVAALAAAVAEGQEVDENAPVADEAQQQPPPPVPPPPVDNFPQNNNQQEAAQDDNNWQPFEWDRAAEELTWERLLGLDGSLVFLEHVFWVISLNTLFIVVFAFSPFHVGHFVVASLKLTPYVQAMCFEGLMTTLIGYFIIGFVLYVLHTTCRMFKFKRAHRLVGMCYLVVKVFLLVLMEIGIFPLVCGCWLDVCSLLLFSASLKDRINSFQTAPGTSAFLHWLVGMVYVFYFASFVLLLREVLRPGVLWFLRNLNDPEFNPIQEMIQFPVYRHIRRFVASLIMFGLTIMLIVYYPIRIILKCKPSVLPYNIHLNNLNSTVYLNIETSLSELSLELLLLQVVLPALLEQSHARHALKVVVKYWCILMSRILGLTEYLLPAEDLIQRDRNHNLFNNQQGGVPAVVGNNDGGHQPEPVPLVPPQVNNNNPRLDHHGGNLGAEHQALLLGGRGSTSFQPYNKPTWFAFRIVALLVCLTLSALIASLICLTVPVMLGRQVIYLLTGHQQTHELYTMACGLYLCWLTLRLTFLFVEYIPWGWSTILSSSKFWASIIFKCTLVALAVLGAIPMLFGVLFQLVVVAPLRVCADQSPLFFPWQDWAMGILHCKIICALIMMGPEWHLKRVFDRVIYQDGFRGLNVRYVYMELIIPTVTVAGLVIAIPYISAHSVLPTFGFSKEDEVVFQRHIYPCLLLITIVVTFLVWQFKQLKSLLIRIRNERYLVGQRLVNYERTVAAAAAAAAAANNTVQT